MLTESFCDFGPPAPCPARFNLAQHALRAAAAPRDKVALTIVGEDVLQLTYGELEDRVLTAAGGLAAAGVRRGDRVVLRIGHEIAFPIAFLGAAALGAVPVPTSPLLSAAEVELIADDTDAALAVVSPELTIDLERPIIAPEALNGPAAAFAETGADELAYVIYTSGSAGRPKGVAHAHRAAWARRMMWDGWYGLTPDDVMMHAGAFNWTYTLGAGLMDPWAVGAATLIYAGPRDPGVWPRLAADHGATIFAAAPGVYRQLLRSDADLEGFANLRHGLAAGESLALKIRSEWTERTGKPIYEALGMTECSTFISSSPSAPHVIGKAGRPQEGRRVALIGSDGAPVPLGEEGVIAVHESDPGLMLGYWNQPEQTKESFAGPWFLTGDVGRMDHNGYIEFLGRNDDMMNALGYRVAPEEVEMALLKHPSVSAAAAVELPVRSDLSLIAAFLTVDGDAPADAELEAFAQEHLARYKVPKVWRVVEDLPRNPNGKLRRKDLVSKYGWKG